jgi:hypothetical protein
MSSVKDRYFDIRYLDGLRVKPRYDLYRGFFRFHRTTMAGGFECPTSFAAK